MTFGLIVLDGWGYSKTKKGNAIRTAKTPFFDKLWKTKPHALLQASGSSVGLPTGALGGSEVGHIHLGAGRLINTTSVLINKSIHNKQFYKKKPLLRAMKHKRVHFIGLCSKSYIHSHTNHLKALITLAEKHNTKYFVHAITDARDTKPHTAMKYLRGIKNIASVTGRFYAMDRDKRLNRTRLAFEMLTKGKGLKAKNAKQAIDSCYKQGLTEEFLEPTLLDEKGIIKNQDAVVFFNFRSDRTRQLTKMFLQKTKTYFVMMTNYSQELKTPHLFDFPHVPMSFGEVLEKAGMSQLRASETEKYPHVTYFFNGERENPFKKETRITVPSPKVRTYDLKPEMSAKQITNKAIKHLNHDFLLFNYANADIVGHTGNFKAAVKAVETVDKQFSRLAKNLDGFIAVADHGNADEMLYSNGSVSTTHSKNPVPCILSTDKPYTLKKNGALYNIAPTMVQLLGLKKPKQMNKSSLLRKK